MPDIVPYKSTLPQIADDSAPTELIEAIESNADIGLRDLPRLKIPRGGSTVWEVRTGEGVEAEKHLDVVLLAVYAKQRAWWAHDVSDGDLTPPDCSSIDGLNGIGNNRLDLAPEGAGEHDCITCTNSAWGSSRKGGRGKDCSEFAIALVLHSRNFLPTWLKIPPTSLKAMKQYSLDLMNLRQKSTDVLTRIKAKAVGDGQIQYAVLEFAVAARLSAEESARSRRLAESLRGRFAPRRLDMGTIAHAETGRDNELGGSVERPATMDDLGQES
jgi:hypothetical protein